MKNFSRTEQKPAGRITVAVAAYRGAEILDVTGPIEVFNMLNRCLSESGDTESGYRILLLAEQAGPFPTSAGVMRFVADASWGEAGTPDTVIVPGSPDDALAEAMRDGTLLQWLRDAASGSRRLVSVCTGAFLLAEAGLLGGKRVTTHWLDLERLRTEYPEVIVEGDAIYIRDGSIATSAGVTAGMDLALALVEEDFGRKLALAVARRLVMFLKRPGGQTQFSAQLRAQMVEGGALAPLLCWLRENAHRKLNVAELAERAAMSPRNFARIFLRETGTTPARYLDQLRLERALALLEESSLPIGNVALKSGFGCEEQFRRSFVRQMGVTPSDYRRRFSGEVP